MIWFHTRTNFTTLFFSLSEKWKFCQTELQRDEIENFKELESKLKKPIVKTFWNVRGMSQFFRMFPVSFAWGGTRRALKASGNVWNLLLSIPSVRICGEQKIWEYPYNGLKLTKNNSPHQDGGGFHTLRQRWNSKQNTRFVHPWNIPETTTNSALKRFM